REVSPRASPPAPRRRDLIRTVQERLHAAGFPPGTIDGTLGRIGKSNGIFAPVSAGAYPRHPTAWTPQRLGVPLAAPAGQRAEEGWGGVSRVLQGRGLGNGRW